MRVPRGSGGGLLRTVDSLLFVFAGLALFQLHSFLLWHNPSFLQRRGESTFQLSAQLLPAGPQPQAPRGLSPVQGFLPLGLSDGGAPASPLPGCLGAQPLSCRIRYLAIWKVS